MLDLIIRGGQVVTPWGVGDWDVAVQGERIVAVAAQGTPCEETVRTIDAAGKIVAPGGIEPTPTYPHRSWGTATSRPPHRTK